MSTSVQPRTGTAPEAESTVGVGGVTEDHGSGLSGPRETFGAAILF